MPAPVRPFLVPGAHALRRHDGRLQVGLDPRSAVVLPAGPATAAMLRGLDGSVAPADADGSTQLGLLRDAGLLVDERAVVPLLDPGTSDPTAGRLAALVRRLGDGAVDVVAATAERPVEVVGFGVRPDRLTDRAEALLDEAGLRVTRPGGSSPDESALGLLVGVGEPDRELLDGWVRRRQPHLLVRLTEGRALVGPFVSPGETACLRCVDAHHTDADPTWPLLVRQYAAASRRPRHDGAPEPLDPLLATVALAWAARDVATCLESGRPALWSTVLCLDPVLRDVESHTWTRHPGCGCSWQ